MDLWNITVTNGLLQYPWFRISICMCIFIFRSCLIMFIWNYVYMYICTYLYQGWPKIRAYNYTIFIGEKETNHTLFMQFHKYKKNCMKGQWLVIFHIWIWLAFFHKQKSLFLYKFNVLKLFFVMFSTEHPGSSKLESARHYESKLFTG